MKRPTMNFAISTGVLFLALTGCSHGGTQTSSPPAETPSVSESTSTAVVNPDLSRDRVFRQIAARVEDPDKLKDTSAGPQFGVALPTMTAPTKEKKSWNGDYVEVYSQTPEKVNQISIFVVNCRAEKNQAGQDDLLERLQKNIQHISKDVFGQEETYDLTEATAKLGAPWKMTASFELTSQKEFIKKLRLQSVRQKCDSHSGYGYRFNYFF